MLLSARVSPPFGIQRIYIVQSGILNIHFGHYMFLFFCKCFGYNFIYHIRHPTNWTSNTSEKDFYRIFNTTRCGGCLVRWMSVWWMSFLHTVWWMSGVADVWWCGCLMWWMSFFAHSMVDVCVVDVVQSINIGLEVWLIWYIKAQKDLETTFVLFI